MSKNLVEIKIDMDDELFFKIAVIAHEKDITFNELCNLMLKEYFENKVIST